jgi:[ribosomal protein S18]-alanine N-acetyltransferase
LNVAFGKGARTSVLEVRENNHETRVLYEKLGFRTVGRRKDYYTDPQDDALTMLLEMREPDSTLQPQ